jgi:hypothetical protein
VSKKRKVIEDCIAILDSHCSPPDGLGIMFDNPNEDIHTRQSSGVLVEEGLVSASNH